MWPKFQFEQSKPQDTAFWWAAIPKADRLMWGDHSFIRSMYRNGSSKYFCSLKLIQRDVAWWLGCLYGTLSWLYSRCTAASCGQYYSTLKTPAPTLILQMTKSIKNYERRWKSIVVTHGEKASSHIDNSMPIKLSIIFNLKNWLLR